MHTAITAGRNRTAANASISESATTKNQFNYSNLVYLEKTRRQGEDGRLQPLPTSDEFHLSRCS
jgi:hypothetical protein